MKNRKHGRLALVAVVVAGGCAGFALMEPGSAVGVTAFRAFYSVPVLRSPLLALYPRVLRTFDGGYIPPSIDKLLCAHVIAASEQERSAITDFYIAQTPGRTGDGLGQLQDDAKTSIITTAVAHLDDSGHETRLRTILLLEYLRLDGGIHKPALSDEERPGVVNQASELYRRWWNTQLPWAEKKRINPLEGSGLTISGIP